MQLECVRIVGLLKIVGFVGKKDLKNIVWIDNFVEFVSLNERQKKLDMVLLMWGQDIKARVI